MELRPGLDLSAAWKTRKKVRRQAGTLVERMRELTGRLRLAPASDLVRTAHAKGIAGDQDPENGRIAIGFTKDDLTRLGAPDVMRDDKYDVIAGRPLVVGRVKDQFGPTVSFDFHTPHMDVGSRRSDCRAAGVIDRAVAADVFDEVVDVSYLVSLIYEGFTPGSPEMTAMCGYAFFELAFWQVQNDMMTMAAHLESDKQAARISVAVDGDEFLPEAVMREMRSAMVEMIDNWDVWVPTRKGIVRPGRLYVFDREIGLPGRDGYEPS